MHYTICSLFERLNLTVDALEEGTEGDIFHFSISVALLHSRALLTL